MAAVLLVAQQRLQGSQQRGVNQFGQQYIAILLCFNLQVAWWWLQRQP